MGFQPGRLLHECSKGILPKRVQFSPAVDLFVGEETDFSLTWWPHSLGVPHQQARVFGHRVHAFSFGTASDWEEHGAASLLAAHVPQPQQQQQQQQQQQAPLELPRAGPNDALMDNPAVARDPDELSSESSSSSEDDADDPPEAHAPVEAWYSTLIYTIEGGPSSIWLDWNDYYEMHQLTARHLRMNIDDLDFMHWMEVPPADTRRANTGSVIAHRRGDLPAGSTDRFILLDVEFHAAAPLSTPEVVRKVRLLPEHISREQLLQGLGWYPYCQRARNRSLMWINDNLIALGTMRISFQDGDYLRIAVPPGSPNVDHIATRCLASAFHQGMTLEETTMRQSLFRLGWHDERVGHPRVPRHRDFFDQDEHALFLQLHGSIVPAFDNWHSLNDVTFCSTSTDHQPATRLEELPHQPDRQLPQHDVQAAQQALHAQPAAIQELFMHWLSQMNTEAAVHPDDHELSVVTWYLDMPRFVNCDAPRTVQL